MNSPCPFCQIVKGELPAQVLFQDDEITVFKDIHPISPVHILIIPNRHITSVNELKKEDENVLGRLFSLAKKIARENGVENSGYRLVVNTGPDAGQSVHHLHMHLLGGRHLPFRFE